MRIALLWLAAAVISGFTLRRYLGPLDEGILMQAATRMGDGEWPWRNFGWAYGPGEPLYVMAAGKLFGPSLLWWRLLRVAADATAAVLVYALVRDRRPPWALAAWAAAAVTAAQPTSANPAGPALAFALGAVLLATRGRPAWAGAAAAAAAFWRPDVGACAAIAAAAALVLAARDEPASVVVAGRDRDAPEPADAPGRDEAAPAAVAGRGDAPEPTDAPGRGEAAPAAGRSDAPEPTDARGRGEAAPAAGRSVAPEPTDARGRGVAAPGGGLRGAVVCLLVAAAGVLVLYAPFLVAAGPGKVWEALVVQASRDGEWWRLPFPVWFGGGDVKDFLTWLAPYAALVTLVLAAFRFRRTAGLLILGLGAAAYYISRADLEHAQSLLVIASALAAMVRPKLAGAAVLALLLVVGTANRASALLRPTDLEPYENVRIPPAEAAALPHVAKLVQQLVPPGEPIYVAPRRSDLVTFSNPLLHYLVDRPNVLHRDVLLQAKPEEQRRIVAALQRARPRAIVRWTAPESAEPEPNRRGRPSGSTQLDDYIDSAYVVAGRFGDYEVLRLR